MVEEKKEGSKKETEGKKILEREYIVPLRKGWLKVPYYKRVNKAVKTLKEFIVRHMKIYDRDLKKVKVDIYLNNELRFRGMKYPPAKIKVRAVKYENGIVEVKLAEIPKVIEYKIAREAKRKLEGMKKAEEKAKKEEKKGEEKKEEKVEEKPEEKAKAEEAKEKEEASKIAEEAVEKAQAKTEKHTSKPHQKEPEIFRKSLKK